MLAETEIIEQTKRVRQLQTSFFATKSGIVLKNAKVEEIKLDQMIEDYETIQRTQKE